MSFPMIENLQWFCAVLLVMCGAVAIGALMWFVIDLFTGGVKRALRSRRNAMPKRVADLTKG